jgi:hypothetical protein
MTGDRAHSKPDGSWDRAGEQGYRQAMYRSSDVETHVRGRLWQKTRIEDNRLWNALCTVDMYGLTLAR